jgi:hypothetical protein
LSENPWHAGDFVWSNFPAREDPARPGPRHPGYVTLSSNSSPANAVFLAYTTSQPWTGPRPFGLYAFDRESAAEMGQSRPFTLDLRRMAAVPVTVEWFPNLNTASHGTIRRAPEKLRIIPESAAKQLFSRRPENIERLGPLWRR